MRLVIADAENKPTSRLTDVVLLCLVQDAWSVWIWSESLRAAEPGPDLCLFNTDPVHGALPVNLGHLKWAWSYKGLALFQLPAATYELNLGNATTYFRTSGLTPGQTLRVAVDSASQAVPVDLGALAEIARLASDNASALCSVDQLVGLLETIVVPSLTPASPHAPRVARPSQASIDKLLDVRRLSVWTPGTDEAAFRAFYSPLLGDTEATRLWAVNQAAIGAVAGGEFSRQVELADSLASSVPEDSVLAGEAAYFKAEGLRLLADLEPAQPKKDALRAEAIEQYQRAHERLKDDPRPLRGIGRITELKGDFDGALTYFKTAKGLCLTEMYRDSTVPKLDLEHETLRTTRHFIHCLLDIRATSPANTWHRHDKERELEGHLQECENLHYELMPTFKNEPEWFYIEWFMGLVFLAKAWGALGQYSRMEVALAKALDARRHIMQPAAPISVVERANLEWWLSVARGQGNVFDSDFVKRVDRLDAALRSNETTAVAMATEDILRRFSSPWSGNSEGVAL